jgi:hypothetical protein
MVSVPGVSDDDMVRCNVFRVRFARWQVWPKIVTDDVLASHKNEEQKHRTEGEQARCSGRVLGPYSPKEQERHKEQGRRREIE